METTVVYFYLSKIDITNHVMGLLQSRLCDVGVWEEWTLQAANVITSHVAHTLLATQ